MGAKAKTLWITLISILSVMVVVLSTALVFVSRSAVYSANVSIGYTYSGAVNASINVEGIYVYADTENDLLIDNVKSKTVSITPNGSNTDNNFTIESVSCNIYMLTLKITNNDSFPLKTDVKFLQDDFSGQEEGLYSVGWLYGMTTANKPMQRIDTVMTGLETYYGDWIVGGTSVRSITSFGPYGIFGEGVYSLSYYTRSFASDDDLDYYYGYDYSDYTDQNFEDNVVLELYNYYYTAGDSGSGYLAANEKYVIIQPTDTLNIRFLIYRNNMGSAEEDSKALNMAGEFAINLSVVS